MKVGDTVWVFDENRRVYPPRDEQGRAHLGGPIWRGHWVEQTVVGENKTSFFVGRAPHGFDPKRLSWHRRILKRDLRDGTLRGVVRSLEELEKLVWMHDNRHELIDRVRRCEDHAVLVEVARLLAPELVPA